MSGLSEARSLVTDLQGHLTGFDCQVSLDPTSAGSSLAAGASVLIISPPSIEFVTATERDYSWEAILASGPTSHLEEAWEALEAIVDELTQHPGLINLTSAEPAQLQPPGSSYEYAGFILRFTS